MWLQIQKTSYVRIKILYLNKNNKNLIPLLYKFLLGAIIDPVYKFDQVTCRLKTDYQDEIINFVQKHQYQVKKKIKIKIKN